MIHKVREAIVRLEADGWAQTGQRGSHRYFEHQTKPGKVTVSGKPSADVPPATWQSMMKQAGVR